MESLNDFQRVVQERIKSFSKGKALFFCKEFLNSRLSIEDRKNFRKFLVQQIKAQGFYQNQISSKKELSLESFLKIESKSDQSFFAVSISHCSIFDSKSLAGFVCSPKEENSIASIGLDIEQTNRVSKKSVARVSTSKEQNTSPTPSLLWTAKEASFKCFSQNQEALLLRDCVISDWRFSDCWASDCFLSESEDSLSKGTYFFEAKGKTEKATGIVFMIGTLTLAYAELLVP